MLCVLPVTLSPARAQVCQKVSAGNGCPVMIGLNRRLDPNFSTLKPALDRGDVDTADLTLSCAHGRIADIKNWRCAGYGYDQRFELPGSKGLLQAQDLLNNPSCNPPRQV